MSPRGRDTIFLRSNDNVEVAETGQGEQETRCSPSWALLGFSKESHQDPNGTMSHKKVKWGAWGAQWVTCLTLHFGSSHDLRALSLSPMSGSTLGMGPV